MGLSLYAPDSSRIVHYAYVDFVSRQIGRPVHIVQYDDSLPVLAVRLFRDGKSYGVPEGAEVNIRLNKPDGKFVYNPALGCNASRGTVYFEITSQMASYAGEANPVVEVIQDGSIASSSPIAVMIDRNPVQIGQIESCSEGKSLLQYVSGAKEAAEAAKASETNAKTSEMNAKASEADARRDASVALTCMDEAAISATSALQSKKDAKVYSDNASTKATVADNKMMEAAEYAKTAKSYANGTGGTRPGEESDNAKVYYENAKNNADTAKEYLAKVEQAKTSAVDAVQDALAGNMPNFLVDLSTGHLTYSGGRFEFKVDSAGHLMWGLAV